MLELKYINGGSEGMIKLEKSKWDRDKFCLNCNEHKDDCKELKFSVGQSDSNAVSICLCGKCRDALRRILESDRLERELL